MKSNQASSDIFATCSVSNLANANTFISLLSSAFFMPPKSTDLWISSTSIIASGFLADRKRFMEIQVINARRDNANNPNITIPIAGGQSLGGSGKWSGRSWSSVAFWLEVSKLIRSHLSPTESATRAREPKVQCFLKATPTGRSRTAFAVKPYNPQ